MRHPLLVLALAGSLSAQQPSVMVPEGSTLDEIVALAATVTPSARQFAWQQLGFTAFVHFGINTFTDREWGDGKEDPGLFSPTDFDADQWARTFAAAGMRGLVLTAKHHDGFCLWPTATTDHSVAASPWRDGKGDVVAEVARACRRHGLAFGIYLSPWDRHDPRYGTAGYNRVFRDQLRELCSDYGPLYDIWFDGANCPKDDPERFDWSGHFALVRELQPQACISIMGPDVRWCGNEAGATRPAEWSVLPLPTTESGSAAGSRAVWHAYVDLLGSVQDRDLGSREHLAGATRLVWYPAVTNTSIRPGWFHHPAENGRIKSLTWLLDAYLRSVGGNTQFLLNVPPDRRGRIEEHDARRLRDLGAVLRATFATDLAAGGERKTYRRAGEVYFDEPVTVDLVELQEDVATSGQRVERFRIDTWDGRGWRVLQRGTTIGCRRLLPIPRTRALGFRYWIEKARAAPAIAAFRLWLRPTLLQPPVIRRRLDGMVTIAGSGGPIHYTLDGSEPGPESPRYHGPFPLPKGGTVKATVLAEGGALRLEAGSAASRSFGLGKGGWRIADFDSEQKGVEEARFAIDEDPATIWHSRWSPDSPGHPHHLTVDLGAEYGITGFSYLPRQDGPNGTVVDYAFEVSADAQVWRTAAEGRFANVANHPVEQIVRLPEPLAGVRFFRFVARSEVRGRPWASAAELGVLVR